MSPIKFLLSDDDCMWKVFSRRATLQWYTVVANSCQNTELTLGLVGFTGFQSLFFNLTFQNETLYKVPSSRKSETKKGKGPNGQTEFGQEQSTLNLDLNNNGI